MVKFPGLGTQTSCSLFGVLADAPQSTRKLHFQVWVFAKRRGTGALDVMSRDVVLAPARNDTVPIQEVSVQTACH